jgi:glycosyltransferase involved in cell wall biosynthesis
VKIALVANSDWNLYGYRLGLIQELRQQGHKVTLISPPGRYVEQLQDLGLTWLPIKLARRGANPVRELLSLIQLLRIYRRAGFHLVHHFTIKCVIYGSFAAKLAGIRAVVNSITGLGHIYVSQKPLAGPAKAVVNLLYRLSLGRTAVIFQNSKDQAYFLDKRIVAAGHSHLIRGSGVDTDKFTFQPEPTGRPQVIMVARFLWNKGIREFVEAAEKINAEELRADFILVGDVDPGNPDSVPVELIKGWSAKRGLKWIGWNENMPQIYTESNVVCLPTYYGEGLPKVLIEAAASGRASITTDIPGCREVVSHEVNGLLIPPKDVQALVRSIIFLIDNPQIRAKMGRAGRSLAEGEFSSGQVNKKTIAVYQELTK